ncbi:dienelactone hydrolase family protein [Deinococcus cellulosilyticus]|uniref:Dienelactone hydrolase n=1 Tax=Deinococcus cellulosilyticus (strain DSM 18568 / NBRC 106333 / KACC 11606 / 5516J-15) TaxID=1223518 RepID=A0A511MYT7_DEIC1|nr:dienelactone hydrolase family protein [Deinococcus cellulosilyticus]GEM45764.1 dienelactone hydrolase [Deinococcus cellulosilyticus NBRC 106333 = KACC 11606]
MRYTALSAPIAATTLLSLLLASCSSTAPLPTAPEQGSQAVTVQIKDVSFTGPSWKGQNVTLTGKLYLPGTVAPTNTLPTVVMMHGCSGIWSRKDGKIAKDANGNYVVGSMFTEWGKRLANNGYVALLVDSFTPRNNLDGVCDVDPTVSGISEVTDRPQDAYAAYTFLQNSYSNWVNPQKVGLLGWSNGGSATLSTLASNTWTSNVFKAGVAFYPGCGLRDAYGGLSQSTYVPYAPLRIWHGSIDDLYTGAGSNTAYPCNKRIDRARVLSPSVDFSMTVHTGAQHSFDQARATEAKWTQDDLNAKVTADQDTLDFFNSKLK